ILPRPGTETNHDWTPPAFWPAGGRRNPLRDSSPPLEPEMTEKPPNAAGRVYLVGAGPGDPGLLTLRGVECLRRADVVLYDYLVNPRILDHARPSAQRVCLGRHGHDRIVPQGEINARMIAEAR